LIPAYRPRRAASLSQLAEVLRAEVSRFVETAQQN
jgi:hypothetical protein